MGALTNTITSVLSCVGEIETISGITTVKDYPAVIKDNPLTGIIVSYGVENIEATYENPDFPGSVYIEIKTGFTIHAPITYSGEDCHNIFLEIIEKLNEETNLFSSYGCGNTVFDRNTATLVLNGWGITKRTMVA